MAVTKMAVTTSQGLGGGEKEGQAQCLLLRT